MQQLARRKHLTRLGRELVNRPEIEHLAIQAGVRLLGQLACGLQRGRLPRQTGMQVLDLLVEQVLAQSVEQHAREVEQGGPVALVQGFARDARPERGQNGIGLVRHLPDHQLRVRRQHAAGARLRRRDELGDGRARPSGKWCSASCGRRCDDPVRLVRGKAPLADPPLPGAQVDQQDQPASDPGHAHGGEQKGLHDPPRLREPGELAGGVVENLQVKDPPIELRLGPVAAVSASRNGDVG